MNLSKYNIKLFKEIRLIAFINIIINIIIKYLNME